MPTSLFQYEMLPTTWFYVSTLIILAMFFKFNRFWSVRNLDLIGLILFTPGLIFLAMYDDSRGYTWVFTIGLFAAVRLIFDTVMVRRPLLEPNLTPGGVTFACLFLFLFVVAALTVNRGDEIDTVRTVRLEQILTTRHIDKKIGMNPETLTIPREELPNMPPGFLPFLAFAERTNLALVPPPEIRREILRLSETGGDRIHAVPEVPVVVGETTVPEADRELAAIPSPTLLSEEPETTPEEAVEAARPPETIPAPRLSLLVFMMSSAILGHLLIVLALVYIGHCHFGNIRTGIACATLYLLLPYTNQAVGRLDHLIPGALILWAVAMYRRPFFAGLWIGAAAALVCYPICLFPLWCSFYWRRGWIRFLIGVASALLLFAALLAFSPAMLGSYGEQLIHLTGKSSLLIFSRPDGFWAANNEMNDMIYRVPIMAVFFVLCFGMILWPAHKHFATLLSGSALLLLSVQFWQIHQGGLFMAWYLPLLILTVFRPNLEDRIALSTVIP